MRQEIHTFPPVFVWKWIIYCWSLKTCFKPGCLDYYVLRVCVCVCVTLCVCECVCVRVCTHVMLLF